MARHSNNGGAEPTVRLSGLLRAYPGCSRSSESNYESDYWRSLEVAVFLSRADGLGLTMSMVNTAVLLLLLPLMRSGGPAARLTARVERNMQLSLAGLLLLSVLQLLLLRRQLGVYLRYRHYITVVNRVLRGLALGLLPVLNHGNDVLSSWGSRQQHSATAALAAYTCLASMMHLQPSLAYVLPTRAGVFLQPLAAAVSLSWVWGSPASMHKLPGMHAAATAACSRLHDVFESLRYFNIGADPVLVAPSVGLHYLGDIKPPQNACVTSLVYAQLLVYPSLLLSLMLPLYTLYVIELHHKLSFWRARGVAVVPDCSLLLPLPEHPVASHVLVCCSSLFVLWYLAEALAPYLQPVAGF